MTTDQDAGRGYKRQWIAQSHADGSIRAAYVPTAAPVEARVQESKQRGYTGDPCPQCQQFTLRISGHCAVCDMCGATTGCS